MCTKRKTKGHLWLRRNVQVVVWYEKGLGKAKEEKRERVSEKEVNRYRYRGR